MRLKIVFSILFLLALSNCGAKKSVVHKKNTGVAIQESKPKDLPSVNEVKFIRKLAKKYPRLNKETLGYIKKYAPIAVKEMHEYKIPASITLAQGILESGKGKSELALKSNNHFGIKCHRKWTGERVYHDDDEKGECFRKYRYPETSYNDHSLFLTQRKRYAFLFDYNIKNYKKWAYGLRKAGYATDRKYPMKLLKIIKDYHLYEFDNFIKRNNTKRFKEVKQLESSEKQLLKLKQNSYEVKKGDTLYSISRMFSISVQSLKAINNLKDNTLAIGQKLIVQE
jgi:flagellum-specific peptidoglycan hydrolase FlgJ